MSLKIDEEQMRVGVGFCCVMQIGIMPMRGCWHRSELARMREPVLTPELAAAARRAAMAAWEQEQAAADERRQRMQQAFAFTVACMEHRASLT